jgi:hypothetical protein
MAKRTIKEKNVISHLENEGFKEITESKKLTKWYKKASERPSCLNTPLKTKIKT